ncbi:MAG: 16S rRNA (cytidine(1402)-2'-O)-methyltransferase [Pseudomonadota bacterium]
MTRGRGEGDDLAPPGGAPRAVPPLDPGLYLVATPIGNARDITLRALDVLAAAEMIAAEDTRQTLKLMDLHGIALAGRPIVAYHDRNGAAQRPRLSRWLAEGRSLAYCSDAGTPLVADPGYRLVEMAVAEGHGVTAVPGASAPLAALSLSALPTDRFLFAGFPPAKSAARRRFYAELAAVPATLVVFESPHRVVQSVADMAAALGEARPGALARELTKRFETVVRAPLGELAAWLAAEGAPKGEIVLLAGPPVRAPGAEAADLDPALRAALSELSLRDATARVAQDLGLPRKQVYARALALSESAEEGPAD